MTYFKPEDIQDFEEGFGSALEKFNSQRQKTLENTTPSPPPQKTAASSPANPKHQEASRSPADRAAAKRRTKKILAPKPVYLVKLAVRKRQLSMDEIFEYYSPKLSRLEAQIDAEKAAKQAGFPIFGHVHDIVQL